MLLLARRRTKVRREAKFVRRIKHEYYSVFCVFIILRGVFRLEVSEKPLVLFGFIRSSLFLHPFFSFFSDLRGLAEHLRE